MLIWSLSNGRGGTNELCRASACLPWLTAAARGTLVVGDFDGDRTLDVAREADGGVVVSLGGNAGFRDGASWRGAPGEQLAAQLLPLGDINGDGRPDVLGLVVGMQPTAGEPMVLPPPRAPRLVLFRGTLNGLAAPEPFAALDGWSSDPRIAVGDLDGDHRPDIALAGIRGDQPPFLVGIRGEPGSLGAAFSWSLPMRGTPGRIAIADVDGDGFGDLLAFGTNTAPSSWSLWPGGVGGPQLNRRRTWTDPSGDRQSWFGRAAAIGRFDGHTVEVAVGAHGAGTVYLYRPGAAQPDRQISGGPSDAFGEKLASVDLNADGRDELVVFNVREVLVFAGARADSLLARQPLSH